MGYYSRTHGAIAIIPPLTWDEYKNSPFRDNRHSEYRDAILHMEHATWTRDAPEPPQEGGPEIVATELRGHQDNHKCYNMEKHLNEFVAAFPGRTYDGYLIRSGERQGDLERYTITNGKVIAEKAELRWPDGTSVDMDDF